MNRPIKLRAWDGSRMFDIARYDFADNTVYSHLFACDGYLGERLEIMQYTGLKDKNGTEICERDILEQNELPTVMKIEFINGCFVGVSVNRIQGINWEPTPIKKIVDWDYEVIGNIYENPELLEINNG